MWGGTGSANEYVTKGGATARCDRPPRRVCLRCRPQFTDATTVSQGKRVMEEIIEFTAIFGLITVTGGVAVYLYELLRRRELYTRGRNRK